MKYYNTSDNIVEDFNNICNDILGGKLSDNDFYNDRLKFTFEVYDNKLWNYELITNKTTYSILFETIDKNTTLSKQEQLWDLLNHPKIRYIRYSYYHNEVIVEIHNETLFIN